ncbi:arsenic resistance protein [Clostridium gasigenes]|uniref:arsenic resistance protein n=1 Tax=Clostridium gasigenes TaxID=94869 RepID=UPI001C0B01B7|nr:bile acid:sodium symporter [Clostridium gasigenes]MBU3105890.1 bile acid:sodium symporter [Clostridium gasigenes]
MNDINKFQSGNLLLLIFISVLLGQVNIIGLAAGYVIIPALIIMLFLLFIQIPISDIGKSIKNIKFTAITVVINFIWTPILVFLLGRVFLSNDSDLLIGFVMLMVTPCTDWYLIFIARAKGNRALGASLLPLNFILQIILLPLYILIIGGTSVKLDVVNLLTSTIVSLLIPLVLASIYRKIILSKKGENYFEKVISKKACKFQGWFLNLAIATMFASQGRLLITNPQVLFKLLIPILLFFIINLIIGQWIGKLFKLTYEDKVVLNLTTLARNSPIALAIAVLSFPDKPIIALALVIGPLIELPVLLIISSILLKGRKIAKVI